MGLRNSLRTKRPLSGILGGVERTSSGLPLAIVYYKDMRVVIPATEMNIRLEDHRESGDKELHNRYAQILSWMMGAEIEFTVSGLDRRSGSVVASRADAMRRKQRQFFLTPGRDGRPLVQEGTVAEARVIAVSERVVRVEVFGVEFPIFAREVAWEWVDDCNYYGIGDRVRWSRSFPSTGPTPEISGYRRPFGKRSPTPQRRISRNAWYRENTSAR